MYQSDLPDVDTLPIPWAFERIKHKRGAYDEGEFSPCMEASATGRHRYVPMCTGRAVNGPGIAYCTCYQWTDREHRIAREVRWTGSSHELKRASIAAVYDHHERTVPRLVTGAPRILEIERLKTFPHHHDLPPAEVASMIIAYAARKQAEIDARWKGRPNAPVYDIRKPI